jgi:hypothetical protein
LALVLHEPTTALKIKTSRTGSLIESFCITLLLIGSVSLKFDHRIGGGRRYVITIGEQKITTVLRHVYIWRDADDEKEGKKCPKQKGI